MPRRKTKGTTKAVSAGALILIDARPIRDKARREYEKVLSDLQRTRQELERFERHDRPGFEQWLHRQFGAVLTEIRELHHKLQNQRQLLFEIQSESILSHCSYARAYERVMWRKAHPEEAEAAAQKKRHRAGAEEAGEDASEGFDNLFNDLFEDLRGQFEREFGIPPQTEEAPFDEAARTLPARLKELYRALARRLHPDAQPAMSSQKREWWHQAQQAYEARDVEQLQVILTLCEIEEQGSVAKTSVSLLMRIVGEFKGTLRSLKAQLNRYRREPAWNFSKLKDRTTTANRTHCSLRAELQELKQALDAAEYQVAMWARQARAGRRPASRRRTAPDLDYF